MLTRGEFTTDNVTYGVLLKHTKQYIEALLITSGTVVSAYKIDNTGSYSYNNVRAKEFVQLIQNGTKGCTSKNAVPMPFALGAMTQHEFTKAKVEYIMHIYRGEVVGAYIQSDTKRVEMEYIAEAQFPNNIPYVKLTEIKKDLDVADDELDAIQTRSVEEIALEKEDITWLQNKQYYIVNDDETAEKLFDFLDNYNGVIAYDTETTGLKINCFGKIGSKYRDDLIKYNEEHPDDKIRADKLVGIIFCVQNDISYYFPCFNRKFKNLYQDLDSPYRIKNIKNIKARYTMTINEYLDEDMRRYVLNTPAEEFDTGVILMERCRHILETKHLVAHNGTFEWKVGHQYGIDTNIKDDTMIMHQLMYKFRSTTRNSGEPSNLKYLAKVELGIDQWELQDFFPNWKADRLGTVREKAGAKKKGTQIDFSYMDYEGSRVYAPTDGDVTFQLFTKYKRDMLMNHKEMEYIYSVEMIVSLAVAYMEFYGHRLDEDKILGAREQTRANLLMIESEIRQTIEYSNEDELQAYNALKKLREDIKSNKEKSAELEKLLPEYCAKLKEAIEKNTDKVINLAAPGQVADLFYNKLGYPMQGDKPSVAKKEVKALLKEKNEDGSNKYPVAHMYSKYKNEDTLMTKFFDNLPYFMYPGGYIFSGYGQIATATGRMSCIEEHTKIMTIGGEKEIKDIKVGEMVYCYDSNGKLRVRKVLNVIDNGTKDCIELNWKSKGNGATGTLICTPDHKILSRDNGWVRADSLDVNDRVYHLHRSNEERPRLFGANSFCEQEQLFIKREVYGVDSYDTVIHHKNEDKSNIELHCYNHSIIGSRPCGKKHVYDLEVEDFHNFIANEICVHNCSKPNAQQYPKVITKIVSPRPGFVMADADYSQIEYRVLTALAKNDWLAELFSDPDSDYHTLMASLMYGEDYAAVTPSMRSAAKSFNFGIPYGMGLGSLAILLTGKNTPQTRDEAAEKMEAYFANQPKTRKFFDDVKEMAQINKYTKTLFNRYRYYSFEDKDGNVNNAKKAASLRQAGNAVIQGSAADIFKIGVARNFTYIRNNKLFGKLLIINMVHDEQLIEINAQELNVQRVLTDVGKNMQFKIEGFPPLFIGAGVGKAWGYAKGKMAEIHPTLLEEMTKEAENMPIFREDTRTPVDTNKVVEYFDNRVYEFRRKKVADYLSNPNNWHKDIHPAIGGLVNLQFNYGRGDEAKSYVGPNGEKYTDAEFLELNIADFLKENNIQAEASWFKGNESLVEEEVEEEYDDGEEDELGELIPEYEDFGVFSMVDESNKLFGSSVHDMIEVFGTCILAQQRICGINTKGMHFRKKDAIIEYLLNYICEKEDEGALEIVFLNDSNILKYTGIFVRNIKASEFEAKYKAMAHGESNYLEGDVNNRSQAK